MIKLINLLNEISQPKYLDLDLNEYHKLPPRDGINITHVAYMLNIRNVCKSIDNSLKPGGILVIHDYFYIVEKMLKYLPNYKILELQLGHYNDKTDNSILVVLKK